MLAGVICLLGSVPAVAGAISRAHLEHGLSEPMRRVGGGSGAWVSDLDGANSGQLFSWASRTPRILASNSKLFTTATALHRLGPDTRLTTRLYPQPRGREDAVEYVPRRHMPGAPAGRERQPGSRSS